MNTIIATVTLALIGPVVLEPGVHETTSRTFQLPVHMDPAAKENCLAIRLWVSEDQGKIWKKHSEIPPTGDRFKFEASKDGLFWFAIQIVEKDRLVPAIIDRSQADQKVYVNAGRRPIMRTQVAARPPAISEIPDAQQMRRELTELRDLVNQLQKRIAELEKAK